MKQAVAALALALGATLAAAQTGGTTPGRSGPKEARPAPATASSAPSGEAAKQAWERTHRASRIIGMDVVNRQGEKVGDIEDIVLDRNGNAAYAVVSTGGFLGVGDRLHAVPWRSLEPRPGNGQFILDIDKETLGKVPGFDNTTFPDVNDPRWSAENRKHFLVAGNAAARSATTGAESSPPKRKERDDARPASARSATGSDVGPQPATSRRSGPAAGAASAGPDAGSAASSGGPTPAGDGAGRPGGTAESATGGGLTNPAGGSAGGTAPAPAGTGSGNGPSPGPLK